MNYRLVQRFGATAVALLLLKPFHAGALELTDPALIRSTAESAVRTAAGESAQDLLVTADVLDARLQLGACSTALQALIAGDGQIHDHTTVGVRCESGNRWALYLGVAVITETSVLVAQHALAQGSVPQVADFQVMRRRLPGLSTSYVTDPAALHGQRLRRSLALGEVLNSDALLVAPIVHRGQELTLLAHTEGMDIRVAVIALTDGKPEERIRVENVGSHRVVEATVRTAQLVEVSL